jgi:cytochrome c-type biogenesis protein CcmH/NrfG
MEDQHLERLLKELPQEQARPGFTARVLARLDTAPPARVRWQPRLTAVVAVAVALTVGLVYNSRLEAERAAKTARAERILRELRAEHGRIKKELEALPEEPPVLYLGGDKETDLVIDMNRVRSADDVQSATYRYDTF